MQCWVFGFFIPDLGEVDLERQAKVEALLNKADAAYAATDYSMRIKSALLRVKAISKW